MLWVDKNRPTQLAKLDYHDDLRTRLQALVSCYCLSLGHPGCFFIMAEGGQKIDDDDDDD